MSTPALSCPVRAHRGGRSRSANRKGTLAEGPEISAVETVIDNGKFGTRTVKFETGLLARQAAGSVTLPRRRDDAAVATAAGKHPKDQFDFFPLTIDVEERMYAAGQIPGSFFRREGRPAGRHPHLPSDRPPAAPDVQEGPAQRGPGRHHRLALDPDTLRRARDQRRVALHPARRPAVLRPGRRRPRRPHRGPVGRVPAARPARGRRLRHGRRRPGHRDRDVAIMMVEAEATEQTWNLVQAGAQAPTEEVVAGGLDAARRSSSSGRSRPTGHDLLGRAPGRRPGRGSRSARWPRPRPS